LAVGYLRRNGFLDIWRVAWRHLANRLDIAQRSGITKYQQESQANAKVSARQ